MTQTLAPAEVIIVDGGSSDGTWEHLQTVKTKYPTLLPIRDETCRLSHSPGPISRGRNVAIAAASSAIVACVDAGCTYESKWLERLTASIRGGEAEYALGGSCLDPEQRTIWDIASAPFFGVKLNADAKTKSCTARSMAFRKELWQRVGGFPEHLLLGEDTVFDLNVRDFGSSDIRRTRQSVLPPRLFSSVSPQTTVSLLRQRWRRGSASRAPDAQSISLPVGDCRRPACESYRNPIAVRDRPRSLLRLPSRLARPSCCSSAGVGCADAVFTSCSVGGCVESNQGSNHQNEPTEPTESHLIRWQPKTIACCKDVLRLWETAIAAASERIPEESASTWRSSDRTRAPADCSSASPRRVDDWKLPSAGTPR